MKASKQQFPRKPVLVWAIDPKEKETRPSLGQFQSLKRWADRMGWEIQPVTVITPSKQNLARGLFGSVNYVQRQLDAVLKKYPKVRSARVLLNDGSTQASAVEKVIRFARQEGAAALAASSHGRSGVDRMLLGSFAEKMLERSPWPVFFLSHARARKVKTRPVVLFPTDFSGDSWSAYSEFLKSASGTKLSVELLHLVSYPLELSMGVGAYVPNGFMEDQILWARGEGTRWVEEAKKRGVSAECHVREAGIGALSSASILDAAKEFGATAIVMNTKSGRVGRFLLGSLAYPVFRSNQYLTILYGPRARESSRGTGASLFAKTLG